VVYVLLAVVAMRAAGASRVIQRLVDMAAVHDGGALGALLALDYVAELHPILKRHHG